MRLVVSVDTKAASLAWGDVQRPGRSLLYDLIQIGAPRLGEDLHRQGMAPYGMAPFGHGAPVFPGSPRLRGEYVVGGKGFVEFGSPVPELVEAFVRGMAGRAIVDWGGVALNVGRVDVAEAPLFGSGRAIFVTTTPVVMKGSGRDGEGVRTTRQAWLLPQDAEFPAYFTQNLRRKAVTLGLGDDVQLEAITGIGPKRSFAVKGGKKVGATIRVEVSGDPAILRALWSWGLGQANAAGFGWIST